MLPLITKTNYSILTKTDLVSSESREGQGTFPAFLALKRSDKTILLPTLNPESAISVCKSERLKTPSWRDKADFSTDLNSVTLSYS